MRLALGSGPAILGSLLLIFASGLRPGRRNRPPTPQPTIAHTATAVPIANRDRRSLLRHLGRSHGNAQPDSGPSQSRPRLSPVTPTPEPTPDYEKTRRDAEPVDVREHRPPRRTHGRLTLPVDLGTGNSLLAGCSGSSQGRR